MKEKNINNLREEIDIIDNEILNLIIQRTSVVDKIGLLKKGATEIVDENRESDILLRLLNLHKGNFSKDSIVRIWREIFNTSANIQIKKNICLVKF